MSAVEHRFGPYGGRYVPETLIPALDELERAYASARSDPSFRAELESLLNKYVGRPSPLSSAPRFSERVGASNEAENHARTGSWNPVSAG